MISSFKSTTKSAITFLCLPLLLALADVQPAMGQPERDPAAITVMQNSVSAMGGATNWNAIQDWIMTGTMTTSGGQATSNFSWTGAGTEFRIEKDTGQTTNLFLSGHGSPAWISNGTVLSINYYVARANPPLYLPGVRLVQELNNQQLTIQYVGTTTVNGVPAVQIHVCDNSDAQGTLVTSHDWYLNAATFMPLQVSLRLPPNENPANYSTGSFSFGSFQATNGLLVPSNVILSNGNLPTESFAVGSVTFNSGVPQSQFDPPQGGGQ